MRARADGIDVVFVSRGVIDPVYPAAAAVEVGFALWWAAARARG